MMQYRFLIIVSTVILMGGLAFNPATAETMKQGTGGTVVLNPGETSRCASDFVVINNNGEEADLKVVLGDKVYIDTMVEPGVPLAYNLPGTISLAKAHGLEDVSINDVAVIMNLGPKAKLEVRCFDLSVNPLRDKDPLKTFK